MVNISVAPTSERKRAWVYDLLLLVVLLVGGDKSSQEDDIKEALDCWSDYNGKKKA